MPPRRYPDAFRADLVEELHGQRVPDPYRWLEDTADPRTRTWVEQQDELYRTERAGWPDTGRWHARITDVSTLDRVVTPKIRGDRVFVARQRGGQERPAVFVREGDAERCLLDMEALDPSGRTTLEAWQPSAAGDRIAYQVSHDGTEDSLLYVLDVVTGQVVDGPIDRIRGKSIGWLPGGEMFYYVRCLPPGPDPADRRYHRRIWLHKVGSAPDTDVLVFGEGRGKAQFYSLAVSADGRWLTITATEGTDPANDVFLADLSTGSPDRPELRTVQRDRPARTRAHLPFGTEADGTMWLRTTQDAPYGRIVACSPEQPGEEHWRTVIAERPGAVLTDFAVLGGAGLSRPLGLAGWLNHSVAEITVHDLIDGTQLGVVELPGIGTIGDITVRPEGGHEAWFGYTDFGTPPQVMHYDARTGELDVWARDERHPAGYGVTARQVSFTSGDGTAVRMFVVSAAGRPDRPRPTILFGYGGFGAKVSAKFAPEALAWTQAGGVFAVACVRGGGDEGARWHRDGRGEHKQNSFDDFAAAADHLVAEGWTEPGLLGILGNSNGGLLVGGALTQHPERFAAVVCMHPLLDMVRYELSGLGPSWVPEYGSAQDPGQLRTLLSYSPYHRVRPGTAYPAVLFTAADGDTRVDPLHARKMCAALQHASTGDGPVLFWLERGVGHGSRAASRRAQLYTEALSFFGARLGLPAAEDGTPSRDRLRGLTDGAMHWIGENLAFFDPFSPSCPLPEDRKVKAVLELAVVCHRWAKLDTTSDVFDRADALLRTIWQRPEFLELVETHGGPWGDSQRLVYAALAPAGVRDDLRAEAAARVTAGDFLSPDGKTPLQRLETRYYAEKANVPHGIESYRELAERSLLVRPPAPPVTVGDAYTITHTAFYLSDYGHRPIELSGDDRTRAEEATRGMLTAAVGEEQWDLAGELVITLACLGGDPTATPEGRAGVECLARAQRADGAIPGRSAASNVSPTLPPDRFFRRAYHTTLVTALLSLIAG